MNTVGFDFGTTNSLVSLIHGDRPISFFDDMGLPVPSVVCYESTPPIVGRKAKERLANAGLGVYGNIVRSPKVLLGSESVFVDGVERSVVDVVADLICGVKAEVINNPLRQMKTVESAVVTIPVNFEGFRRAALRDAFNKAGIHILQFVHEPLAALYGFLRSKEDLAESLRRYDRRLILVFDWGGGTLDLTLCRIENGIIIQVANDGTDEVGGDVFDEALRNEVLLQARASQGLSESVEPHPDAMARLLHRCERGKIDLSTRDSVEIYVDRFFRGVKDDALSCRVSRASLEGLAHPLIDSGVARINSLLQAAGISPAQVALCLATGGMANMPAIKSRLHELFGAQRVHVPVQGLSTISVGAAWIAHDGASLRLAKQVELILARNSYLNLIKAGTEMPREGELRRDEFQLYCSDPRDGFAKFQIVSPSRPGQRVLPNDRRNILETMSLSVDKCARPFFERIRLEVAIDDNLILHGRSRSEMQKEEAHVEIHNLEFGIEVGSSGSQSEFGLKTDEQHRETERLNEKGSVTVRANVTADQNPAQVPGELLYTHEPTYFDVRQSPPRIQVDERLYYEPCGRCGRASNDPECRCGKYS